MNDSNFNNSDFPDKNTSEHQLNEQTDLGNSKQSHNYDKDIKTDNPELSNNIDGNTEFHSCDCSEKDNSDNTHYESIPSSYDFDEKSLSAPVKVIRVILGSILGFFIGFGLLIFIAAIPFPGNILHRILELEPKNTDEALKILNNQFEKHDTDIEKAINSNICKAYALHAFHSVVPEVNLSDSTIDSLDYKVDDSGRFTKMSCTLYGTNEGKLCNVDFKMDITGNSPYKTYVSYKVYLDGKWITDEAFNPDYPGDAYDY